MAYNLGILSQYFRNKNANAVLLAVLTALLAFHTANGLSWLPVGIPENAPKDTMLLAISISAYFLLAFLILLTCVRNGVKWTSLVLGCVSASFTMAFGFVRLHGLGTEYWTDNILQYWAQASVLVVLLGVNIAYGSYLHRYDKIRAQ